MLFRQGCHQGEEVDQLSEEEVERLEDEYDVACAQEVLKAIAEGRAEFVSGEELRRELDRLVAADEARCAAGDEAAEDQLT